MSQSVSIIGAGVAGLTCACELVDRGFDVSIYERAARLGDSACSWYAGGMLAPWCEKESAEQAVVESGLIAADWWQAHTNQVSRNGSLVISPKRDLRELKRFARLTETWRWVSREEIAELEPDLGERFEQGLFFETEAHLDPRLALKDLQHYLMSRNVSVQFGTEASVEELRAASADDIVIDCRGFSARDHLTELRGVKGEMLILKSEEFQLSRPIRLVHPRYPIYLVPRGNQHFMLGATMIESNQRNRITARSMLELLSAAYALHPQLGEAEIMETGVDVRPSFGDNLPAVQRGEQNRVLYVNGLYRHGFLLSPAMAKQVADAVAEPDLIAGLPLCA